MPVARLQITLLLGAVWGAVRDGAYVSVDYFKVLIPLTVCLKIIFELGWLPYLAVPLKPFAALTGLPPDLGIAWAAGLFVNLYSALFVLVSLLPELPAPLTVEQTTVFALMLLFAHSLPIEGRIAKQCGVSFWAATGVRCLVALVSGVMLHGVVSVLGVWQAPSVVLFTPPPAPPGFLNWVEGEAYKLAGVFVIVCAVMLLQRFLKYFGIALWLGRLMEPGLRRLGMGPAAAVTVVIGFCMGLIYGSGIIIKESRAGMLSASEVFSAVTLISLSHALIEDTFLMSVIGASLWGILAVRILVTLAAGVGLNQLLRRIRNRVEHAS